MSIALVVVFTFKEGAEEVAKNALAGLVAATRQESGCLHFQAHQSGSSPEQWMLYEQWADQASIDRHNETAHLAAFKDTVIPLWAAPPDVTTWTPLT